ncbi:MAG: ATP-binding protein [Flexilinea sp.]|nr:ATP-binding protein [Flexilinea sp.]
MFELLNHRYKKSVIIFSSQYSKADRYEQLGKSASPLADAILARIIHDEYDINTTPIDPKKDISIR